MTISEHFRPFWMGATFQKTGNFLILAKVLIEVKISNVIQLGVQG